MTYVDDAVAARADIGAAGVPVTFTVTTPGVENLVTGVMGAPVITLITGAAIRLRGDPLVYQALGLQENDADTLLFTGDTYGLMPPLGSTVLFAAQLRTVKSVAPIAPDGNAIVARIVVAR